MTRMKNTKTVALTTISSHTEGWEPEKVHDKYIIFSDSVVFWTSFEIKKNEHVKIYIIL
jgi:hypothetical protein